jgi:hypothetical protein
VKTKVKTKVKTMNSKDLKRFATTLLAYSAAVSAMTGGCEQEPIVCNTAHGSFAVRYTLVSGTGACATLKSGIIGVQPFVRSGPGDQPRYDAVPVALKTEEMGNLVAEYGQMVDQTKLYALGAFQATNPGPDGFCPVVNLTAAEVSLPAVGARPDPEDPMMMLPPLPAVTLKHEWSNVRFYVDPAFPGTQFTGDLAYTKDGCTATYKVQGLYPAASCGKANPVDGGPQMIADPELCSPCADPSKGRRVGSMISPDIDTVCDEETFLCLPTKAPPSRKAMSVVCPTTPRPDAFPPYDTTPAPRPPDGGADAGPDAPVDAPVPLDVNGDGARDGGADIAAG